METTETWDIGLEQISWIAVCILISISIKRKRKDILLALEIPKFIGYDNPFVNTGNMETTGYDIELGWRDQVGDFSILFR